MPLSLEARKELLQISGRTLEIFLREHRLPPVKPGHPALMENAGAFVTLENRGALRGCIGHMTADKPLYLTAQEMTVQAATGDPRFPPVKPEELPGITIEISVLSPLRAVSDPSEIRVGEHGIVISRGLNRGVLLPQVAVREGWDRESFLGYTCLKAGLSSGDWKLPGTVIEIFSAEVVK